MNHVSYCSFMKFQIYFEFLDNEMSNFVWEFTFYTLIKFNIFPEIQLDMG